MQFEVYKDKSDEYRWRLRHANGNIMADSAEGYKNKKDILHAIETIKQEAACAVLNESC